MPRSASAGPECMLPADRCRREATERDPYPVSCIERAARESQGIQPGRHDECPGLHDVSYGADITLDLGRRRQLSQGDADQHAIYADGHGPARQRPNGPRETAGRQRFGACTSGAVTLRTSDAGGVRACFSRCLRWRSAPVGSDGAPITTRPVHVKVFKVRLRAPRATAISHNSHRGAHYLGSLGWGFPRAGRLGRVSFSTP